MAYGVGEKKRDNEALKKKAAAAEKAAWLKKTRNSPAARSGAFSDDERWALQQKHRASQAARKKKKTTPKAQPKKKNEKLSPFSSKKGSKDKVTGKKTTWATQVTDKDTKTTAFMKRGGVAGWVNRKGKRLRDKLKVAGSAFRKG